MKITCKAFIAVLAAALFLPILLGQPATRIIIPLTPPAHPQTNFENSPILLYVHNSSGPNYIKDWSTVLTLEGSVHSVDYNDFTPSVKCDVIIIDPALNVSEGLASEINSTGKPILALGLGGAQYLNHTGTTVTVNEYSSNGSIYLPLFCRAGAEHHEVLHSPFEVNTSGILLPLSGGDVCAFVYGNGIILVLCTWNGGFLCVNGSVAYVALHNVTTLYEKRETWGKECFNLLMNVLSWLVRGAPQFRLIVAPAVSDSGSVSVTVYTYHNSRVEWCSKPGNVALKVFSAAAGTLVYSGSMFGCNVTFPIGVLSNGTYRAEAERDGCTGVAAFQVESQDGLQPPPFFSPPLFAVFPSFNSQDVRAASSFSDVWLRGAGLASAAVGLASFFVFRRFRL